MSSVARQKPCLLRIEAYRRHHLLCRLMKIDGLVLSQVEPLSLGCVLLEGMAGDNGVA